MSLSDYQPETAVVTFTEGHITVRGLATADVAFLLRDHLTDIDGLAEAFGKNLDQTNAAEMLVQHATALAREAPALVATLIALSCEGEEDPIDALAAKARKLPMGAQIKAIKAIAELTFKDVGGAKKFAESLNQLLMGMKPTTSKTGSRN